MHWIGLKDNANKEKKTIIKIYKDQEARKIKIGNLLLR